MLVFWFGLSLLAKSHIFRCLGIISNNYLNQHRLLRLLKTKSRLKATEDKSSEGEDDDDNKSEENKSDRKDAGDSKDNSANDSKTQTSLDKSVAVKVLNATKISGHAAAGADKLKQAGYANVTAGNPTGKVPGESVVWYKDDSQKAAAEDIAKTLGISAVENEKQIVSPIVVVLCK